jgi:hypothetical protein
LISDPKSSVSHEQQPSFRRVPESEGEHSAEPVHALVAPLLVGVHDRLGIRPRAIHVAARLQLAPDVGVVVDFPVEDRPDGACFVRQRLLAARHVDDAQSPVREQRAIIEPEPCFVGTPMGEDVAHADRPLSIVGADAVGTDQAGNSAHVSRARPRMYSRRTVEQGKCHWLSRNRSGGSLKSGNSAGAID